MRKFLLFTLWLPAATLTLFTTIFLLHTYSQIKDGDQLLAKQVKDLLPKNQYQFYAALPEVLGSFSQVLDTNDARPILLENFLNKHGSPLVQYADYIVKESDKNYIDFRLITAIGMCESNLGKNMPSGSYNAWGYAVYSGQSSGASFGGWDHAISTMAQYLSEKYYSQGLTTPETIGPIYAPPSVNTGNSWAKCVRSFMDELI